MTEPFEAQSYVSERTINVSRVSGSDPMLTIQVRGDAQEAEKGDKGMDIILSMEDAARLRDFLNERYPQENSHDFLDGFVDGYTRGFSAGRGGA